MVGFGVQGLGFSQGRVYQVVCFSLSSPVFSRHARVHGFPYRVA